MKKIVVLISMSLVFSSVSFAKNGERMNERKSQKVSHIDKKISLLNAHKSCVSSASDKSAMKKCSTTHKENMKALRTKKKASRAAAKEKWKAKKKG
jgi:hypothetical protein